MRVIAKADVTELLIYEPIGEYFGGVSAAVFHRELGGISGHALVRINSPGGNFHDAVAIRNLIASRGGVDVVVDGVAASAASIVAMGGETIEMAKGSHMMVHEASTGHFGRAVDFRDMADRLDILNSSMAEIFADKSGKAQDDIASMMAEGDTWMNAETAVAEGFADSVSTAPAIAAYIDQNVFGYKIPEDAAVITTPGLVDSPRYLSGLIPPPKNLTEEERRQMRADWEAVVRTGDHGIQVLTEAAESVGLKLEKSPSLSKSRAARRLSLTSRSGFG